MPLDPEVAEFLRKLVMLKVPPVYSLTPAQARLGAIPIPPPYADIAGAIDVTCPGPASAIPLRVYQPTGMAGQLHSPKPLFMFYHGGGWMLGDIAGYEHLARMLANTSGCVVVSVGYSLSPEARFPMQVTECFLATAWCAQHAAAWGADPTRIVVGGDSAGANLAAAVTLQSRDQHGPRISYQALLYPVADCSFETKSYLENAEGYMLTRAAMQWFWENYLPNPDAANHPLASILRAPDLSGLPAADVITAEYDPLRDEGEAYAARLKAAGVPTRLERYDGMIHGFVRRTDQFTRGREAVQALGRRIRDHFGMP